MNKICLVIHSLGIGGMERVMSQLADNFSKRENTKVDLILIGKNREIEYPLPNSVNIHRPPFQFDNSRRTIHALRTILFIRTKVKKIDPDAVLSFGEYWNNMVLLSLIGLSYPIFISDRSEPNKDLGRAHNFLRDLLYPKATGYVAQTNKAKKNCRKNGWNNNITVIGNPIRKIENNDRQEKENIVLSVGRLIETKHFDHLIRIFAGIGNSDWKLVIVGGDAKKQEHSKELEGLIYHLGVEDTVFLEGEQKNIDEYYKKSKIFAFTSSSEGFPNVIGEAMSAGLPVISYDCEAGPSDMISDGETGYLIPLFDQKKFKEMLNLLIEDDELRNKQGVKALKRIQKYNSKKIANKFYNFITSFH